MPEVALLIKCHYHLSVTVGQLHGLSHELTDSGQVIPSSAKHRQHNNVAETNYI